MKIIGSGIIKYILVLFFLFNGMPVLPGLSNYFQEDRYSQVPVYTVWCEGEFLTLAPDQERPATARRVTYLGHILPDTDRMSFIKKTYRLNNHLHFNIPLICYKYPVSQYTCDG